MSSDAHGPPTRPSRAQFRLCPFVAPIALTAFVVLGALTRPASETIFSLLAVGHDDKSEARAGANAATFDIASIVPTKTHDAPNLAWLCPLCTCAPGRLCDAIHARATKVITNFRAACTLCPANSETAESVLESAMADIFLLDVAYPFLSVDTCSGTPVHACVLCDNVTGVIPNCGVDNMGKMRDLRTSAARDVACRSSEREKCACIHAEELTPISWAECAAVVHRNREAHASICISSAMYVSGDLVAVADDGQPDGRRTQQARSKLVRYHGFVSGSGLTKRHLKLDGDTYTFPMVTWGAPEYYGRIRACYDGGCRPARLADSALDAARAVVEGTSVSAAIAKFYASDADAAGHAAIKAVCRARGAGTTCGFLAPIPGMSSMERGMLVPFAPITSEGTWIDPVVLFSV